MVEIEVKILEIKRSEVEKKLKSLGAKKIRQEVMEAVIYFHDKEKGNATRIRKEKGKVILTTKMSLEGKNAKYMDETEVEVGDFDKMRHMMKLFGLKETLSYKKRRITYLLDDCEIVIDKYQDNLDYVPEYLEIEAPTEAKVYQAVKKLGFSKDDCSFFGFWGLVEYYSKK